MKKQNTLKNAIRLYQIFPQKWLLYIGLLIVFALSGINLFYSFLMKRLLDAALGKDMGSFVVAMYLTGGAIVLEIALKYLNVRTIGKYGEQGVSRIRDMLADMLQRASYGVLKNNHTGDYISRATNDIMRIRTFASSNIILLIYNPLMALGALFLLFFISWKLASITLVVLPVILFGSNLISKPMGIYGKELQQQLGVVNAIGQDIFSGIEIVKAFNLEAKLGHKYDQAVDKIVFWNKALGKRNAVMRGFSQFFAIVPMAVAVGFGSFWIINGSMTPGSLLAFVHLLNHLSFPLAIIPRLIGLTKRDMAAAERIFEILDMDKEREDGQVYDLKNSDNVIEFDDVTFAYSEHNDNILNSISFEVKQGEMVALVGPSGSGKSTLMKLIIGFYNNYKGQIKIFGNSLTDWNLYALRSQISLVSQDTYLFPEQIKENILYGKLSATDEEIYTAALAANADQFIEKFTRGYETEVGELGGRLSGGEKQRISIARAILKNAPILLLDEATSALDRESESLIQEALDNFMKGRTSLVIAHRLSTIKKADRILVIDQGRVVEHGTHESLIVQNGVYRKLYLHQLRDQETKFDGNEVKYQ